MTTNTYNIADYCLTRNRSVIHNGTTIFTGTENNPLQFFGELYKFLNINYPKFHKMDTLCKLGFLASEIILKEKNLNDRYKSDEIGLILYNAASSMDTDRIHQKSISARDAYFPSPSVFVYTLANIVIGEICIRHKIYGEGTFFIEEKYDTGLNFDYVKQLLDTGIMQCCITGWIQVDGEQYDGVLYLVEKSAPQNKGIAIFEAEKLQEIYSLGT